MSSTDNTQPDNISTLPVSELTSLQLLQEKKRIEQELKRITKSIGTPERLGISSTYQIDLSDKSKTSGITSTSQVGSKEKSKPIKPYGELKLQERKKNLEARLQKINEKVKLDPALVKVVSDGEVGLGDPNYGVTYTLDAQGQVIKSIPRGQWTDEQAYLAAQDPTKAPTERGFLLGNVLKSIPPGGRFWKEDIGTVQEIIQEEQLFKDSIYASYLNRPNDVIALKEKLKKIFPELAQEEMNGEVTPLFLSAMAGVAASASEKNYYRRENKQKLLTLDDEINNLLEEGEDKTSRTATSKDFFSLSSGDAEQILEVFFKEAIGRRPNQREINKFISVAKKRAESQPRVTQTVTSPDQLTTENRVTQEGFGQAEAELLARQQAEARPEFAPYQMATNFYDALLAAARSPVGIPEPEL